VGLPEVAQISRRMNDDPILGIEKGVEDR
jgi:hypothetical protein